MKLSRTQAMWLHRVAKGGLNYKRVSSLAEGDSLRQLINMGFVSENQNGDLELTGRGVARVIVPKPGR